MISSDLEFYRDSINYILGVQEEDGAIPWEAGEKFDPWDHIEATMGLSIAGKDIQAKAAFSGFYIINYQMVLGILSIETQNQWLKEERQIFLHILQQGYGIII